MSELVFAGLTSQTIDVFLADSSSTTGAGLAGLAYNTANLKAYYRKGATGSATAITLATQTVGGAWSSGGFVEIDATNMKGVYRLDLVNAMVDTEGFVTLYFYGATNLAPTALRIDCRPVPADLKKILTDAQSATDAKDFFDAGYDPATNKVQGVVLVDTLTTYTGDTPQTGDSYAIVSSLTYGNSALKTLIDAVDNFVDTEIAAILEDTGTTLPAQIAALLTTAGAESYRTDGATGSVFQLLYEIHAEIGEFAISGTTKQQKMLDGTTNAFASTLNDATNPTSVTRAA